MCEGNPTEESNTATDPEGTGGGGAPVDNRPTSRRRNRRRRPPSQTAVDLPPPVASRINGEWRSRPLIHQTPEYLTTLYMPQNQEESSSSSSGLSLSWSPSAPPLLVRNGTFLIAVTTCGNICIWISKKILSPLASEVSASGVDDIVETPKQQTVPPDFVLDTNGEQKSKEERGNPTIKAPIVGLVEFPRRGANIGSETWVATTNDMGDVCIVHITETSAAIAYRFQTGKCGVSAIAIATSGDRIILTYNSSHVEVWSIPIFRDNIINRSSSNMKAQIRCRGYFQSGFPILSVSHLAPKPPDIGDKAAATAASSMDESKNDNTSKKPEENSKEYLILTLQPERHRSSGAMVEVIDLSSLESAWRAAHVNASAAASAINTVDQALPLEDHWVFPAAGMEIVDASSVRANSSSNAPGNTGSSLPSTVHWIPTMGSDCLLTISSSSSSSADNDCLDDSVVCALSDGTVCILSAKTNAGNRLSWGVATEKEQLLLSYPCIGLGKVEMNNDIRSNQENHPVNEEYAVCCLRGATAYLIPLNGNTCEDQQPLSISLRVICYPHDIDSTTSQVQQVQGFTAGNLIHPSYKSTPVLIYAWPGGIIDVYSCGLRKKAACPRSVLQSLLDNGSAKMLHALLLSFDARDDLHERGLTWQRAFDEITSLAAGKITEHPPPLTMEELCSELLTSFRRLLLELAEA